MLRANRRFRLSNAVRVTALGSALATLAAFGSLGAPARADDVSDQKKQADERIAALGPQLEGTNDKLAAAYVALEKTKAALPIAQQKVTQAQQAASAAAAAAAQAEGVRQQALAAEAAARAHNERVAQQLAEAQANEARAAEQLDSSAQELSQSQDDLDAYAAEVFQGGDTDSQFGLVFGNDTPGELSDKILMADTASDIASDTVDAVANQNADDTATRSYLTAVRGEVAELKVQAEESLAAAEGARAAATQAKIQADQANANAQTAQSNAEVARATLDSLSSTQTQQAASLATLKQTQEADLAAARAESGRLQAVLVERARIARIKEQQRLAALEAERQAKIRAEQEKARQAQAEKKSYTPVVPPPVTTPKTPSGSGSVLTRPSGGPTSSGFGMRWHPVLGRWMLHDGLDYAIACGTPVYASADGEVIGAGWRASGWGNQVLIDHGIHRNVDLVTSYNHLTSIVVRNGATVTRGQLIAYSGTTGYSTGCHLHFGTYENGVPVNPNTWL